ncbi:MAG TPA: DUF2950 domain-containing protein [Thermoanaerobaculia bacterium]|jgi:hypothetical protein
MNTNTMRKLFSSWTAAAACGAVLLGITAAARAAEPAAATKKAPAAIGKTFDSPKAAADALVAAAAAGDTAALNAIFGPGGKDLISSGDAVADKNHLAEFTAKAREKTGVSMATKKKAIVEIGNDDWPLPIPVVQGADGKWYYDTKAGREEVLNRRVGENELNAIDLLRDFADAQKEYAAVPRDESGIRQYAQKFVSTAGKHDGLSWLGTDGKPAGPLGDELAKALAEGYSDRTKPYDGYYFRLLTSQGPSARLGARDYMWKGAMVGGFAVVAWPANYGVTGIQTFQINNDGVVYQKDLGPKTSELAAKITSYNPDKTWVETKDE